MSRETILDAVRAHHSDGRPLPGIPEFAPVPHEERVARFRTMLEQVGGAWTVREPGSDLGSIVRRHYSGVDRLVSTVDEPPVSNVTITSATPPRELVEVGVAILRGTLGVAENAAVWVDGDRLPHRALPFVAEHCVLLLSTTEIVTDMHAAYRALGGRRPGYGVFVSGPSKTADIEQALVIGAQGPRSVLVVLEG